MSEPRIALRTAAGGTVIHLSGQWTLRMTLPSRDEVCAALAEAPAGSVAFDTDALEAWDTRLVSFVAALAEICERRGLAVDLGGLPSGVRTLYALAQAVPQREPRRSAPARGFLHVVGEEALGFVRSVGELLEFSGEVVVAVLRLARGQARMRSADLLEMMQQVGAQALPIVSLISVLVGLIFAYIGALQLQQFGAEVYVANLVAIAMAREMAAMMTGIIMAGRTGAAFAAALGTMTVNEEIDALRTTAISPLEFLVLPRLFALLIMMPLLTVYSNLMGILGGAIVGVTLLDIEWLQYYVQTRDAVTLVDFATGLIKAFVYGGIVAVSGCLRGMQCGRSAAAVGEATTSAVVTGIVFIVIASATLTVVFQVLGV